MKSYARIGLSCLLAAMLMSPLMACGSKEEESSGPKKDMATETREQLKELAKSDERLTGDLENKTSASGKLHFFRHIGRNARPNPG